jgi:hypothetical protein
MARALKFEPRIQSEGSSLVASNHPTVATWVHVVASVGLGDLGNTSWAGVACERHPNGVWDVASTGVVYLDGPVGCRDTFLALPPRTVIQTVSEASRGTVKACVEQNSWLDSSFGQVSCRDRLCFSRLKGRVSENGWLLQK